MVSPAQMAFVNTKYIVTRMPDYPDSLAKLNNLTALWQKEIDDKQAILEKMYKDFEKDEPLLTDESKKKDPIRFFIMKRNCAICSARVLDMKGTCLKRDRN